MFSVHGLLGRQETSEKTNPWVWRENKARVQIHSQGWEIIDVFQFLGSQNHSMLDPKDHRVIAIQRIPSFY